jgi:hypothetical protein
MFMIEIAGQGECLLSFRTIKTIKYMEHLVM